MDTPSSELAARLLEERAWLRDLAAHLVRVGEGDDLVQETLVAALEHPQRELVETRSWLAAIARNLARGMRRTRERRARRERRAARPEALPSTGELVERVDTEQRLTRELLALREPYRTTLLLRFHEGLAAEAIAARQGIPAGTVRWRTNQGLAELRARLERAYGGREAFAVAILAIGREGAPSSTAGTGIAVEAMSGAMSIGIKWLASASALAVLVTVGLRMRTGPPEVAGAGEHSRSGAPEQQGDATATSGTAASSLAVMEQVRERERAVAEASIERSRTLRLRILETDRAPHADRLVALLPGEGAELEARRTDRDGWLELPSSADAREILIEREAAFALRATLEPGAGERELVLPEGTVLEGRLVVDGEAPVRPLALEVYPAASEDERISVEEEDLLRALECDLVRTRTDASGRFSLRGADPDHGYNVGLPFGYVRPGSVAVANPYVTSTLHVPRPRRDIVLEVEHLPSIQGRLVEADGRTPTAGLVECRFTWANGTNMDSGARAGEDGWFELFPDEPWRAIRLEYWGLPGERGRASASFERERIEPRWDVGDLRLAQGRTVTLRVLDPEGRPVQGAQTDFEGAATDERGETTFRDVTADSVRVGARGYHETKVSLPPDAELVTATLEPAPELFLELQDRDGTPTGELLVELCADRWLFDRESPSMLLGASSEGRLSTWRNELPFVARYRTDEHGRLRADSLAPGIPFQLRVLAQDGAVVYRESLPPLGADERRALSVRVEVEVLELRGRVLDERGAPVRGSNLGLPAITTGGSTHFLGCRTDDYGRFRCVLPDLPGFVLTVRHRGYMPLERSFARVPDEELELVLQRGYDVIVSVVDELGRPQAGGRLGVRARGEWDLDGIRDLAPGRFEVTGLGGGHHEFVLSVGGGEYVQAHEAHEPELVFRVPVMGALEVSWGIERTPETSEFLTLELREPKTDGMFGQEGLYDTPQGKHRFDPVLPGEYEAILKADTERGEVVFARAPVRVTGGETASVALGP